MPSNAKRELFIGLQPDAGVQQQIQQHAAGWQWPEGTRRTPPANYHLSLISVGTDVSPEREAEVRASLREVALAPIDLLLQAPAAWKNKLAVLCPAPHDGLQALRDRLLDGLRIKEPRFTPHVTIARQAPQAVPPVEPVSIPWAVREFSLMWFDWETLGYVVPERFGVNAERIETLPPAQGSLF